MSTEKMITENGNTVYINTTVDENGDRWWFFNDEESVRISLYMESEIRLIYYYREYRFSTGDKLKTP